MRRSRSAFVALIAVLASLGAVSTASAQVPVLIPLPVPPIVIPLPPLPGLPSLPSAPVDVPPGSPATLQIYADTDPVEDRGFPFAVAYTRPSPQPPTQRVVVTVKPRTADATCADRSSDDSGTIALDVPTPGDSDRIIGNAIRVDDPGTYLVCGWLQDPPDRSPAIARDAGTFTAREPRSSLSVQAPSSVATGQYFPVGLAGTAEIGRPVAVTIRPLAPTGCGPTEAQERDAGASAVLLGTLTGEQTLSATALPRVVAGAYQLCAYLAEAPDQAPESRGSAVLTAVGPSPCAVAQSALAGPQAAADNAGAIAAFRARLIVAAKDRVVLARRAAAAAKTRRGKKVRGKKLDAAQDVVMQQTRLATEAAALAATTQATLGRARAAAAAACA